MTRPTIQTDIEPFRLPNFLRLKALGKEGQLPVADLTDEQAGAYWDWMRAKWLEHVQRMRRAR